MNNHNTLLTILSLLLLFCASQAQTEPPTEWVDPATGHRVIRLSREPGSASLYFHQNAYSPDKQKLIITTPNGLSTIHLKTRTIEQIVEGRVNVIVTGRKSGEVYYIKNGVVFATHLDTKATREIAKLPPRASIASVNADETLFAGDGGDAEMVAHAKDGKWIYLFRTEGIPDVAGIKAPNAKDLIKPGFFQAERLVNMTKHDYRLEPNVTFTPDLKWIVFRSNLHGATHVYAVEVTKK